MTEFMLANGAVVTTGAYVALMAFIALMIAAEGQRQRERGRSANASPGLCGTLGRGLRRLGEALGRFRRP